MGLLTDLKQKLEKGIESTSQRSKKVLDISRITLLIRSSKESEEELYKRLGREVYRYWELKGRLELTDLTRATIGQIKEVRDKIAELEQAVEELKKRESAPEPEEPDREAERELATEQVTPSGKESSSTSSKPRNLPDPDPESSPEPSPAPDENWAEGQAIFFCPHCGNQVDEETVICPHCKQNIYD
ncbi:hypothetical protein ACFQ49_12735 [Kroppenstedtia eburnea]|uniref:Zinc-ribbon domain-containing protein n=1 Tax=Kroppenstedtia eburnea TaxID=714067 RepID=A0A1N7KHW6_9BACL|nr:zinc ribbon domain-containing protein [Kroppenstedtia eburnea]EGK11981.1 hypothetical protein HMPREF9374_1682 [Desmospora sp. 8437]QKI82975.1 zinc-ribbon domain-containing protein [Kroppenstedtia eburnea]SIS61175.1 zinc-ribbon domain-containing protein [Kroppenstedtia eburnea]